MKTTILITAVVGLAILSEESAARPSAKMVEVTERAGPTAYVKVEKNAGIPRIVLDRLDKVSIGTVTDDSRPQLQFVYEAPRSGDESDKLFVARANEPPKFIKLESVDTCLSLREADLTVEATDPDGDSVWYQWEVSDGSLLMHCTSTGHNRFRAPFLPPGKFKTVDLRIKAFDCYGQSSTSEQKIHIVGATDSTSFSKVFSIGLKVPLFPGGSVSSVTIVQGAVHFTDDRDNYYTLDLADRSVKRPEMRRFSNIMSDGKERFGIVDEHYLLRLGQPEDKATLPLSMLDMRKSTGKILARLLPPSTIYVLDSVNKVVDVYDRSGDMLLAKASHYIPSGEGHPISGDWILPQVWCSLVSGSKILVTDLFHGSTRQVPLGVDPDESVVELAVGPGGRVALRTSGGGTIYTGNVFSQKGFDVRRGALEGMGLKATALHWSGKELVVGTAPCGIALYNIETGDFKYVGNARNRNVQHITFLKDGTLLCYDEKEHAFLTYNHWGQETGKKKLDSDMRVDDLDAGRDGRVVALDEKSRRVRLFSVDSDKIKSVEYAFEKERPAAVCLGDDTLRFVAGDTRQMAFTGERMMIVSAYLDDMDDRDVKQVPEWESSRRACAKYLSIDSHGDWSVVANDLSDSIAIISGSGGGSMRFLSYESLDVEQVANVEVLDGVIYILDVYPAAEVVIVDATSAKIIQRWSLGVSKKSELAVADGNLVVLDRRRQELLWHKLRP